MFFRRVRPTIWVFSSFVLMLSGGFVTGWHMREYFAASPQVRGESVEKKLPLLAYSFSKLSERKAQPSEFTVLKQLRDERQVSSYLVSYHADGRKVSAVLNIPKVKVASSSGLPVIVMARGFVEREGYQSGAGTQHVAERFVKKGFVTIAPDFFGYGESDPEPSDALEARFVKPLVVMDLLSSLDVATASAFTWKGQPLVQIDRSKIGLWGHSNGGQISVSVLETTKRAIPTSLWAPVTKSFPYSVLFFTDEYEDQGKGLRAVLAEFEKEYDIADFTIGQRIQDIQAPVQLHQGTKDDAVPKSWSDDFYSLFVGKGKKDQITYHVYEYADHGLFPFVDQAVDRDIEFFQKQLNVTLKFADLME